MTLASITLVNLRGTRESGLAFVVPTYLFIASLGFVVVAGTWSTWSGQVHPVVAPPHVPPATRTLTLWLVLRASAAGCTA